MACSSAAESIDILLTEVTSAISFFPISAECGFSRIVGDSGPGSDPSHRESVENQPRRVESSPKITENAGEPECDPNPSRCSRPADVATAPREPAVSAILIPL